MMEIREFLAELKRRDIAPQNIEFSTWNEWTFVSSYNTLNSNFISESVAMGVNKNPEIALLKSLTEFCERSVFKTSSHPSIKSAKRSDGLAAFPTLKSSGINEARNNAYNEAVERYLWASWWDDKTIQYKLEDIQLAETEELKKEFNIRKISSIKINAKNSNITLIILLAENFDNGYITGGAAGGHSEELEVYNRAFGELLRHLIVVEKIKSNLDKELSYYEQRLWGFASGKWHNHVTTRLKHKGNRIVQLPPLLIDAQVPHKDSDLICVYQCLFQEQPLFIGGTLERLCI
jgi:hypothetical protein